MPDNSEDLAVAFARRVAGCDQPLPLSQEPGASRRAGPPGTWLRTEHGVRDPRGQRCLGQMLGAQSAPPS